MTTQNKNTPLITKKLLQEWDACEDGLDKFNELFPNGAYLKKAIEKLSKNHNSYAKWLFDKCKENKIYNDIIGKGYRNRGSYNTGDYNRGSYNTGDYNTGDYNTGHDNTGDYNTGHRNTGHRNTGHYNRGDYNRGSYNIGHDNTGHDNTGDYNTGHDNTGDYNTGDYNTGHDNTGDYNTGHRNTGHRNTGHYNRGDYNRGSYNIGDYNTGHDNTGDYNTGHRNTGHYNTGNFNKTNFSSGFFNTIESPVIIFNQETTLSREKISNILSKFSDNFYLTKFIYIQDMTEEEKLQHPTYKTTEGYLKTFTYQEASINSWNKMTKEEQKEMITKLPNFNADIFKEITGIDVNS